MNLNVDLEKDEVGEVPIHRTQTWTTIGDELKYEEDKQTVRDHAMSILVCAFPKIYLNCDMR
jgi:hypothetical protein